MKIGIFAKTFNKPGALPVLQAVRDAGYETTQFNMACVGLPSLPGEISPNVEHQVQHASKITGVSIAAVSATYNMIHPNPQVRANGLRQLGVIARSARNMGISLVTLCTGTRDPTDQWRYHPDNTSPTAWRDLLAEMQKAIVIAEHLDIDLGIEPELTNVVSSARHARQLIDELQSPRLKVILDPANLFETADEAKRHALIANAIDLLADHIAVAHAKDRDAGGHVVAAGKGVIDFPHFISCLAAAGFKGPVVAHGLSEIEAPGVAAFLKSLTLP